MDNENREQKLSGIDLAIVIAPLSLLGYGMTYVYNFFYNKYFGIPSIFIDIGLTQVVEAIFWVTLVLSVIFLFEYIIYRGYIYWAILKVFRLIFKSRDASNSKEPRRSVEEKIIKGEISSDRILFHHRKIALLAMLFLLAFGVLGSMFSSEKSWLSIGPLDINILIPVIGATTFLLLHIIHLALYYKRYLEMFLILILLGFSFSGMLGYYQAESKSDFLLIDRDNTTLVVLKTHQDKFLVAPYSNSTNQIEAKFRLYEVNDTNLDSIIFNKVKIYDLKVRDTPTIASPSK